MWVVLELVTPAELPVSIALVRFKLAVKPIAEADLAELITIVVVEPIVKATLAKPAEATAVALVELVVEVAVIIQAAIVAVITTRLQFPVIVVVMELISAARFSEQYCQQWLLLH